MESAIVTTRCHVSNEELSRQGSVWHAGWCSRFADGSGGRSGQIRLISCYRNITSQTAAAGIPSISGMSWTGRWAWRTRERQPVGTGEIGSAVDTSKRSRLRRRRPMSIKGLWAKHPST
ncbi:hypothetical protein VFPBJ_08030 [Purpureocillium lilacinum]|uniref:Uncharacterized protein n=1 Tax=Purpureocillium lilacinum TaxID=33203 RepID=A0A179GJ61_PURLI|nr:hypothetical protein VFPBJ_08030 [Purpureocillium lilacinum]